MTNTITTLPAPIDTGHSRVSTVAELADIPEEEIWLSKAKERRTRRAYRLDVQHFMRSLVDHDAGRTAPGRPQGGDRLGAATCARSSSRRPSTIRRRLAALSSLYKHLVRHDHAVAQPGR